MPWALGQRVGVWKSPRIVVITIGEDWDAELGTGAPILPKGKTYELENVTTLLENNNEEVIEGTCGDFKNLLL